MIQKGIIQRVNHTHVFLQPLSREPSGIGYGFYGPYGGYGVGAGFGWGLAIGTIAGISLLPLFFW